MEAMRVWAPAAEKVEVEIDGERGPMSAADGGWWSGPPAAPGSRYGFSVDGGPVRPDPRSRRQPDGVHGRSAVLDLSSIAWTDDGWSGFSLPDAVVYELHIGTFTEEGTFDAAVDRLDHLVELGVDAVEVLPVAAFPGRHGWGYDGVALFAVHEPYGGVAGFSRFVDACHARGLGVILDVVYNHLGPSGNHLGEFGPYFTDRYVTPWGMAVNFDGPGSDEVRRFVIDNALQWLRDFHVDGLRLDAVHAIYDTSATHLLEELTAEVARLGAETGWRRWVIAESDLNDPRVVTPTVWGGLGCDAQWSDDFHHAVHAALTGEVDGYYEDFGSVEAIGTALERAFVFAGEHSAHRDRRHGRRPEGLPATAFLGYAQNHDQVGNRARGERLVHLVGAERAKAAAALVILSPFVPMLFQGEEWGASSPFQYFTDHDDPALADAVREGRRSEFAAFGWEPDEVPDPQDTATRDRSVLRWEERDAGLHRELLAWHRELIALRKRVREVRSGSFAECNVDEEQRTLVVRNGPVTLLVNLGEAEARFDVDGEPATVFCSEQGWTIEQATARVPPRAVLVLAP